jgi:hypothetical protein
MGSSGSVLVGEYSAAYRNGMQVTKRLVILCGLANHSLSSLPIFESLIS